ncbi:hybrid sensor histidine kinase/response regulator [Planctomicrobium piriforme]|uniref:histidine kinase n=1 Tax=Planctomicrobium piriforme TaxID=1576369 RepID=A0A1I3HS27_9PLAN|nr:hybrid sensor histidine kinase/response regulator [Planctomicrobium piriforme]SFI38433.1 two-component system, chemotaxis family, sensor histidine kinase and response regulator WspE [Planctomicrobium piriforme]
MSGPFGGDSVLMELFREEALEQVQTLSNGLAQWHDGSDSGSQVEPLMRAAHSVKGAARAVGLDPIVPLAHELEECLVQAQAGAVKLVPAAIDVLLEGVDLLHQAVAAAGEEFPQWEVQHRADLGHAVAKLQSIAQGHVPVEPAPTVHAESVETPQVVLPVPPAPTPATVVSDLDWQPIAAPELLAVLREELDTHSQTLSSLLETGTADGANARSMTEALRAIKGAARITGVKSLFELAKTLEQLGPGGFEAKRASPSTRADLQRWLDAVQEIAAHSSAADFSAWLESHSSEYHQVCQALTPVVAASAPSRPTAAALPSQRLSPPPQSLPAPVPFKEETGSADADKKDRVVRVSANTLTRLMGLAGESLVEARWLQPFAQSMLTLKKQHAVLSRTLDDLSRLAATDGSPLAKRLVADAVRDVEECRTVLNERVESFETHARRSDDLNSRLYNEVIASRMRPFQDGTQAFPRMVRDLARQLGKQVKLDIRGLTCSVDRDVLEKLDAPLTHVVRNAIDHGLETPAERLAAGKPETGSLTIEARHSSGMLLIQVTDDGRGIDAESIRRKVVERQMVPPEMAAALRYDELLEFLLLPGFSTASQVTDISGRGVGLDVVHSMVHAVGGTVRIETRLGQGSTFLLQLPITLSVIRAVLVEVAGESYALPHHRIDRLVRVPRSELKLLENRVYLNIDGQNIGLVSARQVLEFDAGDTGEDELQVVLFRHQQDLYGLTVDRFRGEQDLVVRPLDARLGKLPDISAAAILDDGSPILILDVDDVRRSIERLLQGQLRRVDRIHAGRQAVQNRRRVLVVDDSLTVREVQRQMLQGAGYEVVTAVDGMEGWNVLREQPFDLVVSDVDMPRLNGFEFVQRIRSDNRFVSLPVIIVSYKDRAEDRQRGMSVGANYYLTKSSFHDERLLEAVRDLLGEDA